MKEKLTHCTGCTEPDHFDLPEGRTHQLNTIEHPDKTNTLDKCPCEKVRCNGHCNHPQHIQIPTRICERCEKVVDVMNYKEGMCYECYLQRNDTTSPLDNKVKPEGVGEWEKVYDKQIQERILNEDNPQYVLGWNACRYLSKQFIKDFLMEKRLGSEGVINPSPS